MTDPLIDFITPGRSNATKTGKNSRRETIAIGMYKFPKKRPSG
jgi:hypothetical protein